MKLLNKKIFIFPKVKSKWRWPIIIALGVVVISLELYSGFISGTTWTTWLYIIFIIFLIVIVGFTEEDKN